MSEVFRKITDQHNEYVCFWCQGCESMHMIWYQTPNPLTNGRWTWNGDMVKPTVNPSIFVNQSGQSNCPKCHSFIRDGMIQYLEDCSHHLAGKTLPLVSIERWENAD